MKARTAAAAVCTAAVMLALGQLPAVPASAYSHSKPTPEEIKAFYAAHPWRWDDPLAYSQKPSAELPYAAGELTQQTQQSALNCLNLCRYIAGLPADVRLNSTYCRQEQAAALVNVINGYMTHWPTQPDGCPDDLYAAAKTGSRRGNLAYGCNSLPEAIVAMWMNDGDCYENYSTVGHRRWALNPAMAETGFGAVPTEYYLYSIDSFFYAMYAHDEKRSGSVDDYTVWPAENMPYEMYAPPHLNGIDHMPFSVTLGTSYDKPVSGKVSVDLSSQKLGKTYHYPDPVELDPDEPCTFNVNTQSYGVPKCVIFYPYTERPDGLFPRGDTLTVKVNGLTKGGKAAPLTYTVQLFDLGIGGLSYDKAGDYYYLTFSDLGLEPGDTVTFDLPVSTERIINSAAVRFDGAGESEAQVYRKETGYLQDTGESCQLTYTAAAPADKLVLDLWYMGDPPCAEIHVERQSRETTVTTTTTESAAATTEAITLRAGDLNCDGDVNIADAVWLARFNTEDETLSLTAEGKQNADCDRNGTVDADDLTHLLEYLARIIKTL